MAGVMVARTAKKWVEMMAVRMVVKMVARMVVKMVLMKVAWKDV